MAQSTARTQQKALARFITFMFNRPRLTATLFVALAAFGVLSYTTLLKRDGFPNVDPPIAYISGNYTSSDPAQVDATLTKPISALALKQSNVDSVQANSAPHFFSMYIMYKEGTDAHKATDSIKQAFAQQGGAPAGARVSYTVPYFGVAGDNTQKIDLAVSFYSRQNNASTDQLVAAARQAASQLDAQHIAGVDSVTIKDPYETTVDPATGQDKQSQRTFDRYGERSGGSNQFYKSVLIAFSSKKGTDAIKLDTNVRQALTKLRSDPQFKPYNAQVSASYAPSIKENISELQSVLLEGLVAVLIIGSIIIAVRASIITVLSMITVLLTSIGLLYVVGYTLNVITLFALILSLSLIVDDTIIMVEAIDAARRRNKTAIEAVVQASTKVSRAMVAATTTAALSFAPLLFVGGILGQFIRAIPVTIISSLLTSLLVAFVFIPLFSRYLLLGRKQMGEHGTKEIAASIEARVADFVAKPMLLARGSSAKLFGVGTIAAIIGLGFIIGGLFIGKNVVFNIFPHTKDTNELSLTISYPAGTNIEQAQTIAASADHVASSYLGDNFQASSYYGLGDSQSAYDDITIKSYRDRKPTSVVLVKALQATFDSQFKQADVKVAQVDVGPPTAAFTVQVNAQNRPAAMAAAKDLQAYLTNRQLKRASGKEAHFINVQAANDDTVTRVDGKPVIDVTADFDGDDTSTLVTLAQNAVKKEFSSQKLASYGLPAGAVTFDIGQESQNQDSFKSLAIAFPLLLLVIYVLLAFQFRSMLQPLLIFTAIPFSIFGIMFGLNLTNNPISFFAMLGFFALIGLSIKNTILLTDFANQARQAGKTPIDAAIAALEERFRPLIATSITAVVSLIPLALTSPFWQGLAVVLIFGLISSTLLVLTVFPYYYLAAEFLRLHIRRRGFFGWIILVIAFAVLLTKLTNKAGIAILLAILISSGLVSLINRRARRT